MTTIVIAMKMKKSTLAMPPVAAEIPEKPKKPVRIDITKKISAHLSIQIPFFGIQCHITRTGLARSSDPLDRAYPGKQQHLVLRADRRSDTE